MGPIGPIILACIVKECKDHGFLARVGIGTARRARRQNKMLFNVVCGGAFPYSERSEFFLGQLMKAYMLRFYSTLAQRWQLAKKFDACGYVMIRLELGLSTLMAMSHGYAR